MDKNETEYSEVRDSGSEYNSPSSSSDYSCGEERRRRRRKRKHRRRSSHSRRHRSHSQGEDPVVTAPEVQEPPLDGVDGRYGEEAKVVMCSVHRNDLRPLTCRACKAMNHMIQKNLRVHLVVDGSEPSSSAVPQAKDRLLAKRSDHEEPTLVFNEDEMAVFGAIFGQVQILERKCKFLFILKGSLKGHL